MRTAVVHAWTGLDWFTVSRTAGHFGQHHLDRVHDTHASCYLSTGTKLSVPKQSANDPCMHVSGYDAHMHVCSYDPSMHVYCNDPSMHVRTRDQWGVTHCVVW